MRVPNFPHFLPSLLIVGSNKEGREEKATEIIGQSLKEASSSPDFLLLSSPTSIGIDEVRNLQHFLQLKPFEEERKTVFIREAQNLTLEAQNSLLKTLEEPPAHSLIILTTPDASLLLPTIVSRCGIIQLSLTSQVSLSNEELAATKEVLEKLLVASIGERFILVENLGLFKDRENCLAWLDKLTFVGRQQLLASYQNSQQKSFLSLLRSINRAKNYLKANCNLRLAIEVFLIKL